MFDTYLPDSYDPLALRFAPQELSWKRVYLPLRQVILFVECSFLPTDSEEDATVSNRFFTISPSEIYDITAQETLRIHGVYLFSPEYLNNRGDWSFGRVDEIYRAQEPYVEHEQEVFIYVMTDHSTVVDSVLTSAASTLLNPQQIFSNELCTPAYDCPIADIPTESLSQPARASGLVFSLEELGGINLPANDVIDLITKNLRSENIERFCKNYDWSLEPAELQPDPELNLVESLKTISAKSQEGRTVVASILYCLSCAQLVFKTSQKLDSWLFTGAEYLKGQSPLTHLIAGGAVKPILEQLIQIDEGYF